VADRPDGALLERNEVSGAGGIGVLVREGRDVDLVDNRVYSNGYGIAIVFGEAGRSTRLEGNLVMSQREDGVLVLGASPSLTRNRILQNGSAGLRLLDYVPRVGPRRVADPDLENNALEGNGVDAPARGEYFEPPPEDPR
jgi:hypothetical protein